MSKILLRRKRTWPQGDRSPRRCEWCGRRFRPRARSHQRYCGRRCKEYGHLERRRLGLQLRLW
jgi:hypothetical protein